MDPSAALFERFARRGDVDALGEVFDRTAPKLLRLAMHLAGSTEDAEDLLQATFVLAMRKASGFAPDQPLLPWLSGILAGEAKNLARRNVKRRMEELPEMVADGAGPADAAERRELVAQLRANVESLPAEQRQALLLQLQHGLSPAAIAEVLDVPPGTVRMRLHRGLQALRKLLPSALAAWLLGALGTRGLAAVRVAVMREAGVARVTPIGGAAAIAAGAMTMKYVFAAAAVLIAAVLCWWLVAPSDPAPASRGAHDAANVATASDAAASGIDPSAERSAAIPSANDAPRDGTGSLRVRVVAKHDGTPLRDVALRVWPGDESVPLEDPSNRFVRTGDDGVARFDELPRGPWRVTAIGFAANEASVAIAAAATTEHEVSLPGTVLRGIVVDVDGAPIAGAEVRVGPSTGSSRIFPPGGYEGRLARPEVHLRVAAITPADGTFVFAAGEDEDVVAASHAGFRSSMSQLTRAPGVDLWRLVLLPPTTSVSGRVIDSARQPIPGACIAAFVLGTAERTRDGTWLGTPLVEFAVTDASGRFSVTTLPAGSTNLRAAATGYVRGDGYAQTTAGGHVDDVEIVLRRAVDITGVVRTIDGAPARDVVVDVLTDSRAVLATSRVRGDGRFVLSALRPPPYTLVVRDARATAGMLAHPLAPTEERSLHVDLVVPSLPTLRGRVVDSADRALAKWLVVVRDLATQETTWIRTDERGEFVVTYVTGERVNVSVMSPHEPPPSDRPDVVAQAEVSAHAGEIVLRVPDDRLPRASVAGRLVDHTGAAIADAKLLLAVEGRPRHEVATAADGAFRFRDVPAGRYELLLAVDAKVRRELRRVPLAEDDGTPWRGLLPGVYLQRSGGRAHDWLPRLADGSFEGPVEPGPAHVEVTDPDLIAAVQDVELLPGERRVVRIAVGIGRSVSLVFAGDVQRTPGPTIKIDPKDRLHVEVSDATGAVVLREEIRRSPHGDGNWTLEHTFPFGEYTVTARTDSDRRYRGSFATVDSMPQRSIDVPRQP